MQKTVKSSSQIYLILGMTFYAIVGFIYHLLLKAGEKLAIANTLWNAGNGITAPILGYLIFKQALTKKDLFCMFIIMVGSSFCLNFINLLN